MYIDLREESGETPTPSGGRKRQNSYFYSAERQSRPVTTQRLRAVLSPKVAYAVSTLHGFNLEGPAG